MPGGTSPGLKGGGWVGRFFGEVECIGGVQGEGKRRGVALEQGGLWVRK